MTPLLENAQLSTDLDADNWDLLNVHSLNPVPGNIVEDTDPRLTDARVPLDGSVTNASVAADAAIVQSKLDLDGNIPTAWLGTTSGTAAQGDLAEYIANKGQPNGYAGLDSGGLVPTDQLPTEVGTGTVTSVDLTMPSQFGVTGNPITGAGTIAVGWNNVDDKSWFGNNSGGSAAPVFSTDPLPTELIPSLDAAQVTSGTFDPALLPVAVGLGVSHAAGAVPDPGDGTGGALATDYLARDMTYKHVPTLAPSYQPAVPTPSIGNSSEVTGPQIITVTDSLADVSFFYSTTSDATGFAEFPDAGYVSLNGGDTIWVYAAHAGMTNSAIANYTNPNAP